MGVERKHVKVWSGGQGGKARVGRKGDRSRGPQEQAQAHNQTSLQQPAHAHLDLRDRWQVQRESEVGLLVPSFPQRLDRLLRRLLQHRLEVSQDVPHPVPEGSHLIPEFVSRLSEGKGSGGT